MDLEQLINILLSDNPSEQIQKHEEQLFKLIPELKRCKGFNQHNAWHTYDVYDHILCVVNNVPKNIVLRLSALFHDVGKPTTFTKDESGNGHFYGHWFISSQIFETFAKDNNLSKEIIEQVTKLIIYHDTRFEQLSKEDLKSITDILAEDEIKNLFTLKKADLLAQNKKFHYLLEDYKKQENMLLNMYKGSDTNEHTIIKRSKKKN